MVTRALDQRSRGSAHAADSRSLGEAGKPAAGAEVENVTVRYLFLGTEGSGNSIYRSQVADLLAVFERELGLCFDVVDFDPLLPKTLLKRDGRRRLRELRAALPGSLRVLPTIPYENRLGQPFASRLLRRTLKDAGPLVIHARGLWAADLAAQLCAGRRERAFVYDVRGDYQAEHAFHHASQGGSSPRSVLRGARLIQRAETDVCQSAGHVFCVANSLQATLTARIPGAFQSSVVPSCVDGQRFRIDEQARAHWRSRHGWTTDRVLVYVGSLISYQLPSCVAQAGALAAELDPRTHLLWLTRDTKGARRLSLKAGLLPWQFTCLEASYEDVPGFLNAADGALMLRSDDPVSYGASPLKVAEYLACGLPTLISARVGDLSELIAERQLGTVVEDPRQPDQTRAALQELLAQIASGERERIAKTARERLSRQAFLPAYREVYAGLRSRVLGEVNPTPAVEC
jgi:glycosyltransferase involved in cell wall biosynthesis